MDKINALWKRANEPRGTAIVLIAILMVVFLSLTALAVDGFHLFVTRNELHNAADAGALAGARFLYNGSGTSVNAGANAIAQSAAMENKSHNTAVEVNADLAANSGDVERGHWSFASQSFTPNPSLAPVALWGVTSAELDANPNFINAVRTKTRRQSTPAASFFAGLFGYNSFTLSHEAVAYIGFAGTLTPWEVDYPIALCENSLLNGGKYECNIGRMLGDSTVGQTGMWTDFNQVGNPCQGGVDSKGVTEIICGPKETGKPSCNCGYGNSKPIVFGKRIATTEGVLDDIDKLRDCWIGLTGMKSLLQMTLPVVRCGTEDSPTCQQVVGAVVVNVVWITEIGEDPHYTNAPKDMGDWTSKNTDGTYPPGDKRWESFVTYFNLRLNNGTPTPYAKKTVYFLPDCTPHEPSGVSGGKNFGILAKIPVLVK